MSDERRRITDKSTFASFAKKRTAQNQSLAKEGATAKTGAPSWADGATFARNDEFVALAGRLEHIVRSTSIDSPKAREVLARLHALRKEAAESETSIDHWQGRYVRVLPLSASGLSTLQVKSALAHFECQELGPNPFMSLEFAYSPTQVPPDDWALWAIQRDPANQDIVENLLRYCFALPNLANMLARVDSAAVLAQSRPEYARVAQFWNPALLSVRRDSSLSPMLQLPDWRTTSLDMSASPGFPFNVMPKVEGGRVPMSTVRDVFEREHGAFLERIMTSVVNRVLRPSKEEPFDSRLVMYSIQAGNVKHVLRSELGAKPNRAIFSAPLALRLIGGAISQPFYENWSHPGSLLGSSFAHGETLNVLATILRCQATIEAVSELITLKPGPADMHVSVRKIYLKSARVAAPDKREYDMGIRPEPMQEFASYSEGVLPSEESLAETLKPKRKAWVRLHRWSQYMDGEGKVIITNHRVHFPMRIANPSGSMFTTTRNTFIDLAGEEAICRAAWHAVYPHREYEKFCHISAYGDDTVDLFFSSNYDINRLWAKMIELAPQIGWRYKEGTTEITDCLSDVEILGRSIYAWVNADGSILGFFGARPAEKLFMSLVYPKSSTRVEGVNPAEIRQARLVMIADEAFAYPRLHALALNVHEVSARTFSAKPNFSKVGYFDPMFDVYRRVDEEGVTYVKMAGPRTWAESALLHLGASPVTILAAKTGASDEEDIDVDLDSPEPTPAGRRPAAAGEPKKPKAKEPLLPVEDEDLDASV